LVLSQLNQQTFLQARCKSVFLNLGDFGLLVTSLTVIIMT